MGSDKEILALEDKSNLVIIANFWSPTSHGRIAGYRIGNRQ
jgi:hypothetical protein